MKIVITLTVLDESGNVIPSVIESVVIKSLIVNGVVIETLDLEPPVTIQK